MNFWQTLCLLIFLFCLLTTSLSSRISSDNLGGLGYILYQSKWQLLLHSLQSFVPLHPFLPSISSSPPLLPPLHSFLLSTPSSSPLLPPLHSFLPSPSLSPHPPPFLLPPSLACRTWLHHPSLVTYFLACHSYIQCQQQQTNNNKQQQQTNGRMMSLGAQQELTTHVGLQRLLAYLSISLSFCLLSSCSSLAFLSALARFKSFSCKPT